MTKRGSLCFLIKQTKGDVVVVAISEIESGGNQLKIYRSLFGMSQTELAKSVDCSRNTIVRIENNEHVPSLQLSYKIAKVFDLSVEELFNLRKTNNQNKT